MLHTTSTIQMDFNAMIPPILTSKLKVVTLIYFRFFLSLAKIDKKMVRSWRQNHPKRYHPPSIASHATVRTTRSMAPSNVGSAIKGAGSSVVKGAHSPMNGQRGGSMVN